MTRNRVVLDGHSPRVTTDPNRSLLCAFSCRADRISLYYDVVRIAIDAETVRRVPASTIVLNQVVAESVAVPAVLFRSFRK